MVDRTWRRIDVVAIRCLGRLAVAATGGGTSFGGAGAAEVP